MPHVLPRPAHLRLPHLPPPPGRERLPHLTLNTDGRAHPLENTLTAVTFGVGIAAFFVGLFTGLHGLGIAGADMHIVASALGVGGFVVGLYAQLVSATTAERWFIVIGTGGAFVGGAIGLAHGGFLS